MKERLELNENELSDSAALDFVDRSLMAKMFSRSPPRSTRDSIWQHQKQQLIDRLATKGIHISIDDPRLADPLEKDLDAISPHNDSLSIDTSICGSESRLPRLSPLPSETLDFRSCDDCSQSEARLLTCEKDFNREPHVYQEFQQETKQEPQQVLREHETSEKERIQSKKQLSSHLAENLQIRNSVSNKEFFADEVTSSHVRSGQVLSQDVAIPVKKEQNKPHGFKYARNEAKLEDQFVFGEDPACEARRRRQLQEVTRQQLQQQILEKQKRVQNDRIHTRKQFLSQAGENLLFADQTVDKLSTFSGTGSLDRTDSSLSNPEHKRIGSPVPMKSHLDDVTAINSALNSNSSLSLPLGKDPVSEANLRRKLQNATRHQLEQQIMERRKTIEEERLHRRNGLASPIVEKFGDSISLTPSTPKNALPSIALVGSDPIAEKHRKKQMQLEMKKVLQQQIRERSITERMAMSPVRNDFSTSNRSPFVNNYPSPSPHHSSVASRTPVSLTNLDRDPEQEIFQRKKSQTDLGNFLKLQIQERQNRNSLGKPYPIDKRFDSPVSMDGNRRSHLNASSDNLADQRGHSSPACQAGTLLIGNSTESPDTLRQKRKEYAEALQLQMLDRPKEMHIGEKRFNQQLSESPFKSPHQLGENIQTAEIIWQKKRDYAEALRLQMLERKEQQLKEKTEQLAANQRYGHNEGNSSQGRSTPDTPLAQQANRMRCSSIDFEGQRSESDYGLSFRACSDSPGLTPASGIFNYDPVKAEITKKLQRKQFGEELQKQMEEQRKKKEQSRAKEEQENQEWHHRCLKQIEEMNRSAMSEGRQEGRRQKDCIKDPIDEPQAQSCTSKPSFSEINEASDPDRSSSPAKSQTDENDIDWSRAEAQLIQPLRELRSKLALDSDELRQRIAEQRKKIQTSERKQEMNFDEQPQSLPNTSSCWLPVESDSEGQLPVKSEFLDIPPSPVSNRPVSVSDDEILEQFVNAHHASSPSVCSNSSKRRSFWGTPAFPSAMPSSQLNDLQISVPNDAMVNSGSS